MHPVFLQQLFTDEIIQAVCWTLIHSLWQGLLLAVFCGVVIILTRKSNAGLRYNLLSVLFFLFLVTAGFTFVREMHAAEKNSLSLTSVNANEYAGTNIATEHSDISSLVVTGQTYIEEIISYFNTHASLIVTIWFIIFSARCVRLIADLGYAERIKHYKTHSPSAYWQSRIRELADDLQIKKHILLLESEIVKVPTMTGFLKPVVLFPFSMITQLPAEQVEAVLLHELAHIKRKDYFVNLVQSFGEIIFFFNPAVLWISSLIREERENCCDDIAIHHTKNKKQLIHALVAFQEYNIAGSGYALAFPGNKNQLLHRVKRIIHNDNKTLNIMQKIFLTSGLIITCLLSIVFAQSKKKYPVKPVAVTVAPVAPVVLENNIPANVETVAPVPDAPVPVAPVPADPVAVEKIDTLPTTIQYNESFTQGIFHKTIDGKRYEIVVMKSKVTELYIDGERIPDEKISGYQNITDNIMKEVREKMEKAKKDAEGAREEAKVARVEATEAAQQAYLAKKGAEDAKRQGDRTKLKSQQAYMQADAARKEANESKEQAELSMKQAQLSKVQAEKARENAEEDKIIVEKIIKVIISDLLKDGIIKDDEKVSFSLDKEEFIVNGKRQPDPIHVQYKEKYIRNINNRFEYSKSPNSTHLSVQDNDK